MRKSILFLTLLLTGSGVAEAQQIEAIFGPAQLNALSGSSPLASVDPSRIVVGPDYLYVFNGANLGDDDSVLMRLSKVPPFQVDQYMITGFLAESAISVEGGDLANAEISNLAVGMYGDVYFVAFKGIRASDFRTPDSDQVYLIRVREFSKVESPTVEVIFKGKVQGNALDGCTAICIFGSTLFAATSTANYGSRNAIVALDLNKFPPLAASMVLNETDLRSGFGPGVAINGLAVYSNTLYLLDSGSPSASHTVGQWPLTGGAIVPYYDGARLPSDLPGLNGFQRFADASFTLDPESGDFYMATMDNGAPGPPDYNIVKLNRWTAEASLFMAESAIEGDTSYISAGQNPGDIVNQSGGLAVSGEHLYLALKTATPGQGVVIRTDLGTFENRTATPTPQPIGEPILEPTAEPALAQAPDSAPAVQAAEVSAPRSADAVVLLDDRRIEGTITRETDEFVYLNTRYGELRFSKIDLKKIIRGLNSPPGGAAANLFGSEGG